MLSGEFGTSRKVFRSVEIREGRNKCMRASLDKRILGEVLKLLGVFIFLIGINYDNRCLFIEINLKF